MPEDAGPNLPEFVQWSIFPFEGDLRVKPVPPNEPEPPRQGEPGGAPCPACGASDDDYVWVDGNWRLNAFPSPPGGLPFLGLLESRAHLDLDGLDDDLAAELGVLIVRLDRAIQSLGSIRRVHFSRWGDGGSHFHLWFFGRPEGALHMRGYGLPMWERIVPPIPEDMWRNNLATVAEALAAFGGRAIATRRGGSAR